METTNTNSLASYAMQVQNQIDRVGRLLKIEEDVRCEDGAIMYSNLSEQVHQLRVIITKMQLILEDEKRSLAHSQDKLNHLKLLHEKVDHMLIFSLLNSSKDDSSQTLHTSTEKENMHALSTNKENAPERVPVKSQSKRKMGVPSLNPISQEDFHKVPKYMKGRLTLEQINTGITDVNLILSKKYELFNRRRKDLSLKDEKLRAVYLEQGKDLKGSCYSIFFVDDDIQRFSSTLKLKHKTKDSIFLILRHLGKMKETHKGKLTRHCIVTV